ncbi:protease inhibitor I42 family protein [Streptomyces sp. NPDC060198]|uniref:protease inhibitor I42 family protein n=1 Tax=Streptomyces sp. NPDC060198 TaxID=3347070 RepID=UPI00365B63D2
MISSTRTASILRGSGTGAVIAVAALLVPATGCDSGADEPAGAFASAASRPVDDTDITAVPGERFTLTVDQNPSTREYWYLVGPAPDNSVLVSRGQDYASASGDGSEAGSGGRLTFTFEAKGEGTTRFTLLHCTFATCRGNTATLPPAAITPPATASPSPSPVGERVTYVVTVG